jgi:hypothetical protein
LGFGDRAEKTGSGIVRVFRTGRRDLEGNKGMYIFMGRDIETASKTLYGEIRNAGSLWTPPSHAWHSAKQRYTFSLLLKSEKLIDPSSPYPHGHYNKETRCRILNQQPSYIPILDAFVPLTTNWKKDFIL